MMRILLQYSLKLHKQRNSQIKQKYETDRKEKQKIEQNERIRETRKDIPALQETGGSF